MTKLQGTKHKKNILKMSAPQGIKVQAFPVEKFGEIIKKNEITRRTMLLFTTSVDVLRAVDAGIPIDALNIGGMRFQEGRQRLSKALAVTEEEKQAFQKLLDGGLNITIQMVPNDEKVNLKEVIQ